MMRSLAFTLLSIFAVGSWLATAALAQDKTGRKGDGTTSVSFDDESGEFKIPDLVVIGGEPQETPPDELTCDETYIIYSSHAEWVDSCDGFSGPGAGLNSVCSDAMSFALGVVDDIGCPKDCPGKASSEIYRGWSCEKDKDVGKLRAVCAVEIVMSCQLLG